MLPTIETPRLRLRWLEEGDVPALFRIFGDPETMRYWDRPPFRDESEAAEFLESIHRHAANGDLYQWGFVERANDEVIGTCTLAAINIPHRRAELGFAVHRALWGRGYASEAARAIVEYAFDVLDLHRLEGDVDPRNHASIRCLEKLGFRQEGYARERYHLGGEIQDALLYGLLRREFAR